MQNPSILPGYEEEIDMLRKQAGLSDDEMDLIDEIKQQESDEIRELDFWRN